MILGLGLLACEPDPTAPSGPGNVLILLADDLGTDKIGVYAEHPRPAPTPSIDALAARGVLFRNAWAFPLCSPSRSALLTGRMPRRTGVGGNLVAGSRKELVVPEVTLAELVGAAPDAWSTGWLGKWHLATGSSASGLDHPNLQGFDHFSGPFGNLVDGPEGHVGDYYDWDRVVDGEPERVSGYETTVLVDDALELIRDLPEPWLVVVAFTAPHTPLDAPPDPLHSFGDLGDAAMAERYHAVVEAMDHELGRLLDGLPPEQVGRTTTFFLGDNGTPDHAVLPPLLPAHGKESLFEGGVNVPLIVAGPGVARGAESAALVSVLDLFPTVADLASAPSTAELDGHSLVPVLSDPGATVAAVVHTERFEPPGAPPYTLDWRASRGTRFKVLEQVEAGERRVYDLRDRFDDGPAIDLEALGAEERAEVDALLAEHQAFWPTLGVPDL